MMTFRSLWFWLVLDVLKYRLKRVNPIFIRDADCCYFPDRKFIHGGSYHFDRLESYHAKFKTVKCQTVVSRFNGFRVFWGEK